MKPVEDLEGRLCLPLLHATDARDSEGKEIVISLRLGWEEVQYLRSLGELADWKSRTGREDSPLSLGLHLGPRKLADVSQAPVSLWPELVAPEAQQAAKVAASALPHEQD